LGATPLDVRSAEYRGEPADPFRDLVLVNPAEREPEIPRAVTGIREEGGARDDGHSRLSRPRGDVERVGRRWQLKPDEEAAFGPCPSRPAGEMRVERAEERVAEGREEAERTRAQAAQDAERQRRDARERSKSQKEGAAKTARERREAAARAAARREGAIEEQAKRVRLETLDRRGEALEEREEALTAGDEARRLREATSRAKAERKAKRG
jgi:hypothetical protein